MIKILFISPYKSAKSSGWQDLQLSNMGGMIAAYAHNNTVTDGNNYNLNHYLIKVINKIAPKLNVKYFFPYIIERIVKKHDCNVIMCNFLDFALRFKDYIKHSNLPFIIFCHGGDIIWDYKDATTGKPLYNESFFKEVDSIKNKAYFIANSSFTKNQLYKVGVDQSRVFIKHFGLEYSKPKNVASFEAGLKILYVGRMIGCKGPVETIKAFIIAREHGLKGQLTMIGKGPLWEESYAIALSSAYKDDIILKGALPHNEVLIEYQQNDIVIAHHKKDVQTNQEETFGVSILEAFSHGLPVITGKSGGISDIVENGFNGFLVKPGDIYGQADAILQLYNNIDLYNDMSKNCIETIKNKFSKQTDVQNMNSIINSIISSRKREAL